MRTLASRFGGLFAVCALLFAATFTAQAAEFRQISQILSSSGKPVVNGYIYIGTYGLDPVANPISLFSDSALSVAIANPVRTDSYGRPTTDIYFSQSQYSYTLKTSAGVVIEGPKNRDAIPTQASVAASQAATATSCGTFGGTADVLTCTLSPAITAYTDLMTVRGRIALDNTGAVTLSVNGVGARNVVKWDGTALAAGELQQNDTMTVAFDSTNNRWQLQSPNAAVSTAGAQTIAGAKSFTGAVDIAGAVTKSTVASYLFKGITTITSGSGNYTVPSGVRAIRVRMVGGGGGSGFTRALTNANTIAGGGPGQAGYYVEALITSPAGPYAYAIGSGGTAGTVAGLVDGGNGGNTTFGTFTAKGGAGGRGSTVAGGLIGCEWSLSNGAAAANAGSLLNIVGAHGSPCHVITYEPAGRVFQSLGGTSLLSGTTLMSSANVADSAATASAGASYGGGASGAFAWRNAVDMEYDGAAGAAGAIFIEEYF